MREAKFRGKPINPNAIGTAKTTNGGWVYGYLSRGTIILPKNDLVPASCTYAHPLHIAWPDNDVYINCNVDPCTVGQFTGLHDKNGREIYEGDIVKCRNYHGNVEGDIKYYNAHFYLNCSSGHSDEYLINCSNFEIIGNAYEDR